MTDGSLVSARLLVFRVGTLACAAEVDQVREILPRLPTTRIPGAPPVVAGLVNVRGTLVTVVEGWRALGQSAPSSPAASSSPESAEPVAGSTIILEVPGDGDNGSRSIELGIDGKAADNQDEKSDIRVHQEAKNLLLE